MVIISVIAGFKHSVHWNGEEKWGLNTVYNGLPYGICNVDSFYPIPERAVDKDFLGIAVEDVFSDPQVVGTVATRRIGGNS